MRPTLGANMCPGTRGTRAWLGGCLHVVGLGGLDGWTGRSSSGSSLCHCAENRVGDLERSAAAHCYLLGVSALTVSGLAPGSSHF